MKKNLKSKGFTLIELLAVILILGIIALIAIPTINSIITDAEMSSILSSMRNLIDAGEKYYARNGYIDTSCIDANSSELDFRNNSGDIKGSICFNGTEAYLKDVIYEGYVINGTTDELVYSKISIDKLPVYTINETTFDGVDDYYDTGYSLFDEAKDFTIVVSVTSNSSTSSTSPITIFHCMYEATPYPGLALDHQTVNGRLATSQSAMDILSQPLNGNKNILVVTRDATANKQTYYVFNSDGEIAGTSFTLKSNTFDQHLLVGAYQAIDGTKGRFFKGTIHYFGLYMEALTETEIRNIMLDLK